MSAPLNSLDEQHRTGYTDQRCNKAMGLFMVEVCLFKVSWQINLDGDNEDVNCEKARGGRGDEALNADRSEVGKWIRARVVRCESSGMWMTNKREKKWYFFCRV